MNRFNSMWSMEKQLISTSFCDKPQNVVSTDFAAERDNVLQVAISEQDGGPEDHEGKVLVVDDDVINCEIMD